jgi:hypothetical protein
VQCSGAFLDARGPLSAKSHSIQTTESDMREIQFIGNLSSRE